MLAEGEIVAALAEGEIVAAEFTLALAAESAEGFDCCSFGVLVASGTGVAGIFIGGLGGP